MFLLLLKNRQDVALRGRWKRARDRTRPGEQLKRKFTDRRGQKSAVWGSSHIRYAVRACVDARTDIQRHRERALSVRPQRAKRRVAEEGVTEMGHDLPDI